MTTRQTVSVDRFADVREQALVAFGEDPAYAVSMASQAYTILTKRFVWKLRTELRQAETKARTLCEASGSFVCHAMTPCGTGQCKFAEGDLARLEIEDAGDPDRFRERPQRSSIGPYDLDVAIPALRQLRPMTDDVIESLRRSA